MVQEAAGDFTESFDKHIDEIIECGSDGGGLPDPADKDSLIADLTSAAGALLIRRYWEQEPTATEQRDLVRAFRNAMQNAAKFISRPERLGEKTATDDDASRSGERLISLLISAANLNAEREGGSVAFPPKMFEVEGKPNPDWRGGEAVRTALNRVQGVLPDLKLLETCATTALELVEKRPLSRSLQSGLESIYREIGVDDLGRRDFESFLPEIYTRYFKMKPSIWVNRESEQPEGPFLHFWLSCLRAVGERSTTPDAVYQRHRRLSE